MDAQSIFNWIGGLLTTILGGLVAGLYNSFKSSQERMSSRTDKIEQDIKDLAVLLPTNYITRNEVVQLFADIKAQASANQGAMLSALNRLEEKMERKL